MCVCVRVHTRTAQLRRTAPTLTLGRKYHQHLSTIKPPNKCIICLTTLSVAHYIASNDKKQSESRVGKDVQKKWSLHLISMQDVKDHQKPQSEYQVSGPRFEGDLKHAKRRASHFTRTFRLKPTKIQGYLLNISFRT